MKTNGYLSYDVTVIRWITVKVVNKSMTTLYITLSAGTSNVMTTSMTTMPFFHLCEGDKIAYKSHCQNSSKFLSVAYFMKTADMIMFFFLHMIGLIILVNGN